MRHWSVLLACCAVLALHAQERPMLRPVTDAELWLSTGVEWKPFKKKSGKVYEKKFFRGLRTLGELGYRGNENLTSSKLFYTLVGARYRVNKIIRFGVEHRYNFRDRYTSNSHRLDVLAQVRLRPGRWELDYRPSYQHDFVAPTRYRTLFRNRLAVGYNIPKWKCDPHVSVESFTALHYTGEHLIGMRYEVGTEVRLDKKERNTMELAVRYDREMDLRAPQYRWIFAVAYQFTLQP